MLEQQTAHKQSWKLPLNGCSPSELGLASSTLSIDPKQGNQDNTIVQMTNILQLA